MDINQKYRICNIADAVANAAACMIATLMVTLTIFKWAGHMRVEQLEDYDDTMMMFSVAFVVALFIVMGFCVLTKYLRIHEPEEGYYPLTFTEAYREAKKGRRYESTSGMILEVGPDGKPMLTKDGSEVSGTFTKFDIAYDVYWRRIREESNESRLSGILIGVRCDSLYICRAGGLFRHPTRRNRLENAVRHGDDDCWRIERYDVVTSHLQFS